MVHLEALSVCAYVRACVTLYVHLCMCPWLHFLHSTYHSYSELWCGAVGPTSSLCSSLFLCPSPYLSPSSFPSAGLEVARAFYLFIYNSVQSLAYGYILIQLLYLMTMGRGGWKYTEAHRVPPYVYPLFTLTCLLLSTPAPPSTPLTSSSHPFLLPTPPTYPSHLPLPPAPPTIGAMAQNVYQLTGQTMRHAQFLSFIEIFHAVTGLVKSSVFSTVIQVTD